MQVAPPPAKIRVLDKPCEFAQVCPVHKLLKQYPQLHLSSTLFFAVTYTGNSVQARSRIRHQDINTLLRLMDSMVVELTEFYNQPTQQR